MAFRPRSERPGHSSDLGPSVSRDDRSPADEVRRAGFVALDEVVATHLPAGTKCRLHVNQNMIKADRKDGGRRPVFTVKRRGKTSTGSSCWILDGDGRVVARLVYRPDDPLSCGARAWIETDLDVVVV